MGDCSHIRAIYPSSYGASYRGLSCDGQPFRRIRCRRVLYGSSVNLVLGFSSLAVPQVPEEICSFQCFLAHEVSPLRAALLGAGGADIAPVAVAVPAVINADFAAGKANITGACRPAF